MKFKNIDLETIKAFAQIVNYNLSFVFEDKLFETFYRKVLQQLILKLARATQRITHTVTLHMNETEAICFRWAGETMLTNHPGHSSVVYFQKYFPTTQLN